MGNNFIEMKMSGVHFLRSDVFVLKTYKVKISNISLQVLIFFTVRLHVDIIAVTNHSTKK